uniref:SEC14 cytosolic factor n=1 Tax=Rhizophora mucronata TaxID=61149 RepID=A0A2P2ME47_RHIMU
MQIIDIASLPHFCKREGSGSSRHSESATENCFSMDHPFHQKLYDYMKQQGMSNKSAVPAKQGSFHVDVPVSAAEGVEIAKTIESEFQKLGNGSRSGLPGSLNDLKIYDD